MNRTPRPRRRPRRWLIFGGGAALLGLAVGILVASGAFDRALQELTLPLRHQDIIRQQAREKGVDAALIAAVIDTESKFNDVESSAGARGLMQITPEAAKDIARHSGATTFHTSDLSDPEINIRYGTYLLAERIRDYHGNVVAALASYNAGPGPVEKWGGDQLTIADIEFPETRAYVEDVLQRRKEYRQQYAKELGYSK